MFRLQIKKASYIPLFFGLAFFLAAAGGQDRRAEVLNVRYHCYGDYTRIVLDLAMLREFTSGEIRAEGGIFVDVFQAKERVQAGQASARLNAACVKGFALSQKTWSTVRLFVEVDFAALKNYRIYHLRDPFRLVIDLYKTTGSDTGPAPSPGQQAGLPSEPLPSGYTVARQLGLGVKTIVIDPGHGGAQPGCIGKSGLQEKEITLDLALNLYKELSVKGFQVFLTRTGDQTVSLAARTALANQKKADLFISIHVNAHRDRKREGVETFFLNFSPDPTVIETAASENASSETGIGRMTEIIAKIVRNDKIYESRSLAEKIQKNLVKSLSLKYARVKDHGIKGGPFWVLIGGNMPSVLVEVAHLSNSTEEKLLKDKIYRNLIVKGLQEGILAYIKSLGKG